MPSFVRASSTAAASVPGSMRRDDGERAHRPPPLLVEVLVRLAQRARPHTERERLEVDRPAGCCCARRPSAARRSTPCRRRRRTRFAPRRRRARAARSAWSRSARATPAVGLSGAFSTSALLMMRLSVARRFSPPVCWSPSPASTSTRSPDLDVADQAVRLVDRNRDRPVEPTQPVDHARRGGGELAGHQLLARVDVRGRQLALEARRVGDRAVLELALRDRRRLEEGVLGHHVARAALLDQALGHEHGGGVVRAAHAVPIAIQEHEQQRAGEQGAHQRDERVAATRREQLARVGALGRLLRRWWLLGGLHGLLLARRCRGSGLGRRAHAQPALTLVGGRSSRMVEVAVICFDGAIESSPAMKERKL